MEPLRLEGKLNYIERIDCGNYTRNRHKPLYQDSSGRLWLGKDIEEGDEHIREFIGYHLIRLFNHLKVFSPKIKTHPEVQGYLTEFIAGLEPYFIHGAGENPPSWLVAGDCVGPIVEHPHALVSGWKKITGGQKQHIVACFVNDDYDRNPTNYKVRNSDLWVLDQAGGWGTSRNDFEFGTNALNASQLLIEPFSVDKYKEGIMILRRAMSSGYYDEVIRVGKIEDVGRLNRLQDNTKNIEDIINHLFKLLRG